MKTYAYAARFEPMEDGDGFVVTFDDVPEAITEGDTMKEAREMAADALGVALLTYIELGRSLPVADAKGVFVTPDADVAAKIAVIETFRESGMTRTELGRQLGKDEKEVRRMLDPNHQTKLQPLTQALAVMGMRLVVGLEAAE
ncbi:type II toxin-antitoxin system HicB family antitoxin [Rhizobium sp. CFBP 8762]|uniref:type II toxin-antitoxin system HicB family antitoxin n=1 Tax=Rhizobium sp. CFBP 8762 TaxID=2775279 RepID=UPI001781E42F|nr:type II toxin-antitoxin system HicB family antitoxin [Rhizobium sp. CFBP 8762]MBD8556889.1 type II toxin-antitoxin system HicB family antitoxin [Rhizobium sp. CFBP 8762]